MICSKFHPLQTQRPGRAMAGHKVQRQPLELRKGAASRAQGWPSLPFWKGCKIQNLESSLQETNFFPTLDKGKSSSNKWIFDGICEFPGGYLVLLNMGVLHIHCRSRKRSNPKHDKTISNRTLSQPVNRQRCRKKKNSPRLKQRHLHSQVTTGHPTAGGHWPGTNTMLHWCLPLGSLRHSAMRWHSAPRQRLPRCIEFLRRGKLRPGDWRLRGQPRVSLDHRSGWTCEPWQLLKAIHVENWGGV